MCYACRSLLRRFVPVADEEQALTVREVARRLNVTEKTVRRLLHEGKLRGVMLGGKKTGYRIQAGEVRRLLEGRPPQSVTA